MPKGIFGSICATPGRKIRSKGLGKGLGRGRGLGPISSPKKVFGIPRGMRGRFRNLGM